MNDIETRLRADAELDEPTPPFDTALTQATARSPRRHTWLAAAAAVLIVGGGAAAISLGPAADHDPAGGSSAPADVGKPVEVPVTGAILAPHSDAPKQLMLVVPEIPGAGGICPWLTSSVVESPTQVRVHVHETALDSSSIHLEGSPAPAGPSAGGPPVRGPDCANEPYTAVVTGLKAPLGSRPIIDDATGQPIKVYEPTIPAAGHTPDGYTEVAPEQTDPMSSATLDFRPGSLAPMAVGRFYENAAGARMVVVAAPSDAVVAGAQVIDHATVDGHDATVTETAQTRCVTWAPSSDSGLQVCSDTKPAKGAGSARLSEAELLQVARSLH